MNRLKLYLLLRKNVKLSERRNVMFDANRFGRLFTYLWMSILAIEFIALGTFLGWMGATEDTPELIFYITPLLLILDFLGRFATQQTPLMLVKPYLLMPISKYAAIDCFLVGQMVSSGNLVWMTLFAPYAFIVCCGGLSVWQTLGMLCLLHLMVVCNSQWYLLVRTLVNRSMLWWLLPATVYGTMVLPFFVLSDAQIEQLIDVTAGPLEEFAFSGSSFLVHAVLLIVLAAANRRLQMRFIYDEISKQEKTKLKHVSQLSSLDRFGQIGEYLKLEIKSTMRNKAMRTRFIQGVCFITFFSLMIAFTSAYDSTFERNFWCLYAFIFFGSVNLSKVMCAEGNYIDLLMVHEENILTLLLAKYYFYCAILLLPLTITLIPVIAGKFTLIMVLAYLLTTTGPVYLLLFQMAVYNKQTQPLNEKITGKNQLENKWQAIASMTAMFAPIIEVYLLMAFFGTDVAYWVLFAIGLAVTLSVPLWMRNIYSRMMGRRYENLEGFHSTR